MPNKPPNANVNPRKALPAIWAMTNLIITCPKSNERLMCSVTGTERNPFASSVRNVLSFVSMIAASAAMLNMGNLTPPFAPTCANSIMAVNRSHSNRPSTMITLSNRKRSAGSGSVKRRLATYGNAASKKLNSGSNVKQIDSCVNNDRMTKENLSGTRIGYLNNNLLNSFVNPRKENPFVPANCSNASSPQTSCNPNATSAMSALFLSKKPSVCNVSESCM
mmetsp:Transcript_6392/g.20075  ORF Transcript_6392/g.20075 Transcript_6392/m.20075 type:complete len:221 (+) Transcript_6392:651-1313(+)